MDSHQVEDFGIDDNGELWVQRKGEGNSSSVECPFATQYNPPQEGSLVRGGGYFFSRRCGTWCPLLGNVQDDLLPVKSISLCHKTLWCNYKQ